MKWLLQPKADLQVGPIRWLGAWRVGLLIGGSPLWATAVQTRVTSAVTVTRNLGLAVRDGRTRFCREQLFRNFPILQGPAGDLSNSRKYLKTMPSP